MRNGRIYIIKNKCNDKVYIGQTTLSIEDRFKQHKNPAQKKRRIYKLYKAMDKYGVENFYVELLEDDIPYNLLDEREIYWIEQYDSFKNGYNSTPGGDGKTIYKIDDVLDIIKRLEKGDLIQDVAVDYNVNPCTIRRTLRAYGIKTQDFWQIPRERLKELYLQEKTYEEIGKELHINPRSVSRVIKELNINKKPRMDYSKLDLDSISLDIQKWKNNEIKKKEIQDKYNIKTHHIDYIIKNFVKDKTNDNGQWKQAISKDAVLLSKAPTKENIHALTELKGISDEMAKKYFRKTCSCGKKCNPTEVAMFYKTQGRMEGEEDNRTVLCQKCLCELIGWTKREYLDKANEFRDGGCNLF